MGIVTDYLRSMIARQVDDHGLVLWFDPERHYLEIVQELNLPHTTIARYEGSFFALRHEIEPLLAGLEPSRLVVYVPVDPSQTHNALIEVEAAGVVMKPGQQPPNRNTRLSVIARNALKSTKQWTDEDAEQVARDIEAGKYKSLEEIEQIVVRRGEATGVLQLIFGTGDPVEVALKFLCDNGLDAKIYEKAALTELSQLMAAKFGLDPIQDNSVDNYRARLARHILVSDLIAALKGELPVQLTTIKSAADPLAREASAHLAKTWRFRRDLRESYFNHAKQVEEQLGLAAIDFKLDQIASVETFLEVERALQRCVETALFQNATYELVEIAKQRQSSFWSEYLHEFQAHWALIAASGQVLLEADRISEEMKSSTNDVKALLTAYTQNERPWCLLDTYHRHTERRYHNFNFDLGDRHRGLEQLITKARQRYMEVGSTLAEHFLRHFQESKFQLDNILRQTEIFERAVKPNLAEGKTVYFWVDALRFEMARELTQILSSEFDVKMQVAIGAVPTITEIGMAALLPAAHQSAKVVTPGENRLALEINGTVVKDRKDRVNFLKANAGVKVFDIKLDDLLPRPKKKAREGIREAELILITSQEIDALCEGDNVPRARRAMEDILHDLHRALRILGELEVKRIILTADHGYVFGDELSSEMKIDAPGGNSVDLHRRVWVGQGGRTDPSFLRARVAEFGWGGDLEIAVPWNFACFKVKGGAKAYFHGGLSPQEIVIPVMALTPKKMELAVVAGAIKWELIPGSQKISTRFFSVQIKGHTTGLFELVPPKVRIEIRAKAECLSAPVSASYGYEEGTGDVQLRSIADDPKKVEANTVTVMITKESPQKTVTVHLLDAISGAELARLEKVEMAISI